MLFSTKRLYNRCDDFRIAINPAPYNQWGERQIKSSLTTNTIDLCKLHSNVGHRIIIVVDL